MLWQNPAVFSVSSNYDLITSTSTLDLTHEQLEIHGCVFSTIATDAVGHQYPWCWLNMGQVTKLWLSCYLVLLSIDSKTRYQDSHSSMTWTIFIVLDQFHIEILHLYGTTLDNKITFWRKLPSFLRVKTSALEGNLQTTYWDFSMWLKKSRALFKY